MYGLTGVQRPEVDTGYLDELQGLYSSFSRTLHTVSSDTDQAIDYVSSHNSGPAYDGFIAMVRGADSITSYLVDIEQSASDTAAAFAGVSAVARTGINSMNSISRSERAKYEFARLRRAPSSVLNHIISNTRSMLLVVESSTIQGVNSAFNGVVLPDLFDVDFYENDFADGIVEDWNNLEPDMQEIILQNMADRYAEEHGIDPITVEFLSPNDPAFGAGANVNGYYVASDPPRLVINADTLGDPARMNTVIHEMEHHRQYSAMNKPIFGPMNPIDALRWRQLNQTHVRERGGSVEGVPGSSNQPYWPRPIEVGAREAGKRHVATMSFEEYESYKR